MTIPGKPSLSEIMQKAQEMQKKMQDTQKKLALMEVQGEAGGGLVKITMNCQNEMRNLAIDPILLKETPEIIADVIVAAYNNTRVKVEALMKKEMVNLSKDMGLPENLNEITSE